MRGVPRLRLAISNAPSADHRRIQQRRHERVHDLGQFLRRIELQPRDDAEAVAQRIGQHAGARSGADQRERLQIEPTERAAGPSPIMMSIW